MCALPAAVMCLRLATGMVAIAVQRLTVTRAWQLWFRLRPYRHSCIHPRQLCLHQETRECCLRPAVKLLVMADACMSETLQQPDQHLSMPQGVRACEALLSPS